MQWARTGNHYDYSIYDAKRAGFTQGCFIIRRDLERDFREISGTVIAKEMDTEYVFQEPFRYSDGFADKLNGRRNEAVGKRDRRFWPSGNGK